MEWKYKLCESISGEAPVLKYGDYHYFLSPLIYMEWKYKWWGSSSEGLGITITSKSAHIWSESISYVKV